MKNPLAISFLSGFALLLAPAVPVFAEGPPVDYAKDIQPLLSAKCYECHGEKKSKASLRLDIKSRAFKGGEDGPVIVAGKSGDSEIIKRVSSDDPEKMMPPKGARLTPDEIAWLKKWIDDGATWPDALAGGPDPKQHWAFKAPVRPKPPEIRNPKIEIRNPIDAFVAARLEKEGLEFSPEAEPPTLLRRLHLDLTGLPPAPAEVEAFRADPSPQAWEKKVDELLASRHYGERWARPWLDAARYADSQGYEKDPPRYSVWFWRDWVINALNSDMPYDRFIIEQIAGDLLPNATQDQIVATGFLRHSMLNEEGGVDPEQFRMEAMFDRMDCIGKAVLGLTIQCCQCHDHKFDPLLQADYYKMFAFLNNEHEPQRVVYSAADWQKIGTLKSQMSEAAAKLKGLAPDWMTREAAWEDGVRQSIEWKTITGEFEPNSTGGQKYLLQKDGSYLAQSYAPTKHTGDFEWKVPEKGITAIRLELMTDPNLPCNGPGRSLRGTGALSEISVSTPTGKDGALDGWKFKSAEADFGDPPDSPLAADFYDKTDKKRVTGPAGYAIDGKEDTAWGCDAGPGRRNEPHTAIFTFAQPIGVEPGALVHIYLKQNHGGWNSDDLMTNNLGRFRLSYTTAPDPKIDPVPPRVRAALDIPRDTRTDAQWAAIFSHWRTTVPDFAAANAQIDALWKQWPAGSTALTLQPRDEPRMTAILKRGDWLSPTTPVTAGVPAVLHQLPKDAPPNRLTFAKWLAARESPTTARVMVNRVWQQIFGTGLVITPEDLGVRCEAPIHPELLDWLSVEFVEHGWSLKNLIRQIVTSRTYRQSSRLTPAMQDRDPDNRLLARGARFRVDAEIVRDIALATSGLLTDKVGGPSVMTPAPGDLFKPPTSYAPFPWVNAEGPDKYRRALYTFRRRSTPYPALQVFDAPNGDQACIRRARSNTPLQALTTLNEDVFVDCARALAHRILADGGATNEERINHAFRQVLNRPPEPAELDEMLVLISRQKKRIADGFINPSEVATGTKEVTHDLPKNTTPADFAAYTIIARVLLNLDEAITKE